MKDIFLYSEIYNILPTLRQNKPIDIKYRGIVVLERGYVDIELNIYGNGKTENFMDYHICLKHGEDNNSWSSECEADIILGKDGFPNVDWSAENWLELLKEDMENKLDMCVQKMGWHYDMPN